jgi:isopentenyl-diphosphate delta-isomerase
MNNVILVNEKDQVIGEMEKLEAHQKGLLHRAFSVFVFNDKNELLLQKRALGKYHSEGLWTNTCCSHPEPNESILDAGKRRLKEEMNYVCDLKEGFSFIYKVDFENGLSEHELDHVIIGYSNENPVLNPEEASDFKWMSIDEIEKQIQINKEDFTFWFVLIITKYKNELLQAISKNA